MKKIFNLYKNLSAPIKASIWFTVSNVIQKGIALLSTPIFTRLMTTEQYGVYSVYQSWYSIISIFATLNLYAGVYNNGLLKADTESKKQSFTSSMLGLSTTITCILFVIYLVGCDFWTSLLDLSPIFMFAMFAELLFAPAFSFWSAKERFDYKYKKLVGITVLMGIFSPLLGVIAVIDTEHKTEARVLSFVFVQVCVGLIIYIYTMYKGREFFNKDVWKFALAFNLPLIPHYLSQTILGQADRIMISKMVGSTEAAIYSVTYTISMMFNIVMNAINNSLIPYIYKSMKNDNYASLRKNMNFITVFVAIACLVATAFGPEIIKIFASPEYYEAHKIVPPVAVSLLFIFLFGIFGSVEFYFEETRFIMVASSVAAVLNIILNYFGIQYFGYMACAYTTLFCYILLAIVHYIAIAVLIKKNLETEKTITVNSIYDGTVIWTVSCATVIGMIVMLFVYEMTLVRYLFIFAILILTVVYRNKLLALFKDIRK